MTSNIDASVVAKAEECFLALLDDQLSYAECQAWIDWCDEKPQHQAAYEQVARLWAALDGIDAKSLRAVDLGEQLGWPPVPKSSRAWLPVALACTLVAAVAVGISRFDGTSLANLDHQRETLETRVSHTGSFQLADGTVARLAGDTRIETDYSAKERRLTLLRGEAFFAVSKDAQRPFVVAAGAGEARALGTKFDVNKLGQTVSVTVSEGLVQVSESGKSPTAADPKSSTIVGLGERVSYSDKGLRPVEKVDLDHAMAWASGRLVLRNKPLAEVIEEVNRFSLKRIVFRPDEVAGLTVSGTVDLGQIDDWLHGLEKGYPLKLLPGGDDTLLLTRLVESPSGLAHPKPKK